MTSRDFCYWLQGFFEVSNVENMDDKQTEIVKRHLNLVFKHEIDPSMGDADHQIELNKIHNSGSNTTPPIINHFNGHGVDKDGNVMRC